MGRQGVRIQPQTHGVLFVTPDVDLADAVDSLEARLEEVVREGAELQQAALITADIEENYRIAVGIRLRHGRGLRIIRQTTHGGGHPVTHIIGSAIQVITQLELNADGAAALAAYGLHGPDARDGVDFFFEDFGDLVFDHRGIGSGVARLYGNQGTLRQGKLPHRQVSHGDQAEYNNDRGHDNRQHGPANAQLMKAHQPSPDRLRTSTAWPSRTLWIPEVITSSPGVSP